MLNTLNRLSAVAILCIMVGLLACSPDHSTNTDNNNPGTDTAAPTAAEVVPAMGTGFNLGNTFDLTQHPTMPESIMPIIDLYYNAGMRHIRIPITWLDGVNGSTLANSAGVVNFQHPRFLQLEAVIKYALDKKMYVVINAHHERSLKENYDGTARYDTVFYNLWHGIADHFKEYSDHLIFDVLNEPEGACGDWNGGPTPYDPKALALTRSINLVGYNAIRATGGKNRTRIVMVEPNGQGNQSMIDEVYPDKASLPGQGADPYLAFQVHTYDPWSFCGETGKNSAWPGESAIINGIALVAAHSTLLGVPVNYGEFGVGRDANPSERNTDVVRGYYRIMRLAALSRNMSLTVWDDRGWFGLIGKNNAGAYDFLYSIVPTMMAP